jgi:hypothetical protein
MSYNVAIDVFIGLIFIYLLYSLLATVVMEIIATQLAFRSKILEKAIMRMLEDGKTSKYGWIIDKIGGFFEMIFRINRLKNKPFATSFYAHPLIKYLGEDGWFSKPAYITAQNFSKVMIDLLQGINTRTSATATATEIEHSIMNGVFKSELLQVTDVDKDHPVAIAKAEINKKATQESISATVINQETCLFLQSIWLEAGGDVEKFKVKLEDWFDDTMQRATGWYKRFSQGILFIVGLIIAVSFNVDSIGVGRKLEKDPKLREQMVTNAATFLEQQQELGNVLHEMELRKQDSTEAFRLKKASYEVLTRRTDSLMNTASKLIADDIGKVNTTMGLGYKCDDPPILHIFFFCYSDVNLMNFLGWVITALAISLGAPFWFDMLSKVMKLRSAGTRVSSSSSSRGQNRAQTAAAQPITVNVNTKQPSEGAVG